MSLARPLVLGGGGVTGIAWEIGVLAGLAAQGVDLTTADLVIGTSAGSVVAAQITGGLGLDALYAAQQREATAEIAARLGVLDMLRWVLASAIPGSDQAARRRLGRLALRARTPTEDERYAVFRERVGELRWPDRRVLITAVDAETGEFKVFDRASGVPLIRAVAASCAVPLVWPPVTIEGRRYVDGGVRSGANADLAAGCDRVVVVAPITVAMRRSARISVQLATLGAHVRSIVIAPDAAARAAIGRNVLDPAQRPAAARAGHAQGAAIARAVSDVWDAAAIGQSGR